MLEAQWSHFDFEVLNSSPLLWDLDLEAFSDFIVVLDCLEDSVSETTVDLFKLGNPVDIGLDLVFIVWTHALEVILYEFGYFDLQEFNVFLVFELSLVQGVLEILIFFFDNVELFSKAIFDLLVLVVQFLELFLFTFNKLFKLIVFSSEFFNIGFK